MKESILFRISNPIPVKNRRLRIIVNQVLLPIVLILMLWVTPRALIAKNDEINNISLYSNSDVGFQSDLMARMEKYNIKLDADINIFLPSSESEYNLLTLYTQRGTLGLNLNALNMIFINPNCPETRKPVDIVVHEVGHSYLKQEFGLLHIFKIPTWKQEGFCEYISESSTFPFEEGLAIFKDPERELELKTSNKKRKVRYMYFTYRLVYEYLVKEKGMSLHQIFETDLDFESLKNEIRNKM